MPATWTRTPLGGSTPAADAVEVRRGGDHAARDDAVVEDPAGVVDVVEEPLERL